MCTTKFSDMPKGSRNGWLAWCSDHDWSNNPFLPWYDEMTGEIVTYADEIGSDDWKVVEARHKTPRELKAWAGY